MLEFVALGSDPPAAEALAREVGAVASFADGARSPRRVLATEWRCG